MSEPATRTYVVSLTIPDNEAFTALATLARLGLPAAAVVRSDVWVATVDAAATDTVDAAIPTIETIFNPNKHRLEVRSVAAPLPGEVWITARDEMPRMTVAGRTIAGVIAIVRYTAWRLLDESGSDVAPGVLDRATEMFLCNPAFQEAIR